MKKANAFFLSLAFAFIFTNLLYAGIPHGSKEEAQAMAERAADMVLKDPSLAHELIQHKGGHFMDKDIYVFACTKDGVILAHGGNPKLVGMNGHSFTDVDGYPLMKDMLNIKDTGWVHYKWPDPSDNNKIKPKSTYIIRVGEEIVGAGYYPSEPEQNTQQKKP